MLCYCCVWFPLLFWLFPLIMFFRLRVIKTKLLEGYEKVKPALSEDNIHTMKIKLIVSAFNFVTVMWFVSEVSVFVFFCALY